MLGSDGRDYSDFILPLPKSAVAMLPPLTVRGNDVSSNRQLEVRQWIPPAHPSIKINFDRVVAVRENRGAYSLVTESWTGSVIFSYTKCLPFITDVVVLEAIALCMAVKVASDRGLHHVIFKGDGVTKPPLNISALVEDACRLANEMHYYSFKYVPKITNWVAHGLAKKALESESFSSNLSAHMLWLENLIGLQTLSGMEFSFLWEKWLKDHIGCDDVNFL
ncbi:conserved hypothetical protein [Ricinus communis]|uniref:RNase H type-1 domain-containing protein n=1 Tax=Ricinus communis TaxID=3988 RepID=B9SSS2_RICCO|nr:conserved hypothetical protein [Ricinus communis]